MNKRTIKKGDTFNLKVMGLGSGAIIKLPIETINRFIKISYHNTKRTELIYSRHFEGAEDWEGFASFVLLKKVKPTYDNKRGIVFLHKFLIGETVEITVLN